MDSTKGDFQTRKEEIDNYFTFLKIIDAENTLIKYDKDGAQVEEKISSKLQTMFIANAFLILYNLIESTVRNSIVEIYEKIKEDEVTYSELSENLKKLWVQEEIKNIKEGTSKIVKVQCIINRVVDNEVIALTKDNINISGNIDADKIRKLADNIGFNKSDNEKNGRNLVVIKHKRNGLAHGNFTFYDVGKDYSVKDLNKFKQETFDYLSDVIYNIESFINEGKYKTKIAV